MKEEYNYTLTVPLAEVSDALALLETVKTSNPKMRLSRKPDTKKSGRFYLCFPFSGARTDLKFNEWYGEQNRPGWELYGPNYGVWGLS